MKILLLLQIIWFTLIAIGYFRQDKPRTDFIKTLLLAVLPFPIGLIAILATFATMDMGEENYIKHSK